jgi:PilZ domain
MSDPVMMARSARERLAQGLQALQQPGVPAALLNVAEPVAQAMSALHQIEASHGAARPHAAPQALDAVRRALSSLQSDQSQHPAVAQAVEAVAGSLGFVHGLTQGGPPEAAAAPAAAQRPRPDMAFAGTMVADQAPPQTQPSPPQAAAPQQYAPPQQQYAPPPQQQYAPPPQQQYAPPPQQQYAPPAQQAPQQSQRMAPAAAGAGGALRVDAELGVHSTTNFYKGLSGNDVIDSGGIFIATYQIPQIGRELMIHVSMPGGYEFQAKGVVRWTREAPLSSAGPEAPPGFGAQFTEITPEARQLVYRYVRNREPLFHDDL